ncbi:HEAT repeat domain-containing protein [Nostoc sp. FACHB-190]|uniref:HEAT repeat domain-containing protein n=1 Tax=Nostoc sp. FACHB-190 TaxID=2692838 RepID=UPI00168925C7|nr:HEAT repeat domain-containing protein [Nostoc sp. FACHB-190]MBD2301661.1 HEAT repeat domain-containing protein [Nostoc sp. FACHB-190]
MAFLYTEVPFMAKHIDFNFWAKVPNWLLAHRVAVSVLTFVSPLIVSSISNQTLAQTPNSERVDQLIQGLSNEDLLEQLNIVTALGNVNDREFSSETLDKLKLALVNPDWRVRSGAALVLSQKGGLLVKDALPTLVKTLQDPNWFVRSSAARAIGNIVAEDTGDSNGANTVIEAAKFSSYLVDALQDSDFSVRFSAATSLVKLNTKSAFIVSRLISNLSNTNDPQTRLVTAENLNNISTEVTPILPNLGRALKHGEPSVRALALETIGSISTDTSATLPYLIQGLQDPDWTVRSKAARAVVRIVTNLQEKSRANFFTASDLNAIDELQTIQQILQNPQNHFYNNEKAGVSLAINALQAASRNR